MIEGLGAVGIDALNLGRADLLLSPGLLASLASRAKFPIISANAVNADGKPAFRGWVVKEIGGQRVGIFGVSGDQQLAAQPGRVGLAVLDPFAAARSAVAELRGSCRLVIALSQLGLPGDERLAREVPGIDLILGGFSRTTTSPPRFAGSTMILHAGAKGMRIGRLEVELGPGSDGAGAWSARAAAAPGAGRLYSWSIVPLDASLPDHPVLAAQLERHREDLRAHQLTRQETAAPAPVVAAAPARPPYVGAAACGSCHPVQHREWSESGHARAFAALERKRQDLNPECLPCHVTAYGDPGGYRPGATDGLGLRNVQCEACHGFGRDHSARGKIRGRVSEAVCRRCHSTENSPTFRYEPYLRKLGAHTARYFTRQDGQAPAEPASAR